MDVYGDSGGGKAGERLMAGLDPIPTGRLGLRPKVWVLDRSSPDCVNITTYTRHILILVHFPISNRIKVADDLLPFIFC